MPPYFEQGMDGSSTCKADQLGSPVHKLCMFVQGHFVAQINQPFFLNHRIYSALKEFNINLIESKIHNKINFTVQ